MQRRGLVPNILAYSAAIIACKNGHQTKQATRLLQEMNYNSIVPDVIAYSAAINACEKGSVTILVQAILTHATA